jgi:hypothetical protein
LLRGQSRTFQSHPRDRGRSSRSEMPPSTGLPKELGRSRTFAGSVQPASLFAQKHWAPQLGDLPQTKPKLLPLSVPRRRLPTCAARHDPRAHPRAPVLVRRIKRHRAASLRRAMPAGWTVQARIRKAFRFASPLGTAVRAPSSSSRALGDWDSPAALGRPRFSVRRLREKLRLPREPGAFHQSAPARGLTPFAGPPWDPQLLRSHESSKERHLFVRPRVHP